MQELNAPIPGMSLTGSPKGGPHERPPQLNDPEDALQLHLANLSKPEVLEAVFDAMDTGMDVQTLTEGILRSAVAAGRHSIDVSLIIAPVIHEFIRANADAAGVEFEEGFSPRDNKEAKLTKKIEMTERTLGAMRDMKDISSEDPQPELPKKKLGLVERRA